MRLGYKVFRKIKKWYGSTDFELGYEKDGITIRFGYWEEVNEDQLRKLLPCYVHIQRDELESDDCGWLYHYKLTDNRWKK